MAPHKSKGSLATLDHSDAIPDWAYRFILHLDALEERHSPGREGNWIGFLTETLLPRLGVSRRESAASMDWLRDQGIVILERVPNPKAPSRPTTLVKLNREHRDVTASLEQARALRLGFVPIEVPPGSAAAEMIAWEREERGGTLPAIRPTAVEAGPALVWSVRLFDRTRPVLVDFRDESVWKGIGCALQSPDVFGVQFTKAPATPSTRTLVFCKQSVGRAAALVDFTIFDDGLAQCAVANHVANLMTLAPGGVVSSNDVPLNVVWTLAVRRMSERIWPVFRAMAPAAVREHRLGITANVHLAVRSLHGTRLAVHVTHLTIPDNLPRSEMDGGPIPLVLGYPLAAETLPPKPLDEALDRLAEFFGLWSHKK